MSVYFGDFAILQQERFNEIKAWRAHYEKLNRRYLECVMSKRHIPYKELDVNKEKAIFSELRWSQCTVSHCGALGGFWNVGGAMGHYIGCANGHIFKGPIVKLSLY